MPKGSGLATWRRDFIRDKNIKAEWAGEVCCGQQLDEA